MTSLDWHYGLCEIEEGLTITAPNPGNPVPSLLGYPQLLLPVTLSHFPERMGYLVFLLMDYTLAPSSWGILQLPDICTNPFPSYHLVIIEGFSSAL